MLTVEQIATHIIGGFMIGALIGIVAPMVVEAVVGKAASALTGGGNLQENDPNNISSLFADNEV